MIGQRLKLDEARPTWRHWAHYILGNVLGFAFFTGIFYVALRLTLGLLEVFESLMGPIPNPFIVSVLDALASSGLVVAGVLAVMLTIVRNTVNWDSLSPYTQARLDATEWADE